MAALKDHDDLRADGLASEANTIVDRNEHYAEKADIDAENTDFEAEKTDVEGDSSSGNAVGVLPEDTLAPSDYPAGLQFFFILIALILSIFMVALDLVCVLAFLSPRLSSSDKTRPSVQVLVSNSSQTIVATAIPKITDQFHSVSEIGWYGSAFFLTVASFTSPWGKLFKYFPLKWAYLAAVFIFELGSLICGTYPRIPRVNIPIPLKLTTTSSARSKQHSLDCRTRHCRSRRCRCCVWRIHSRRFPRSAREAPSISRYHRCLLRYLRCHRSATRRRVHRASFVEMVFLHVSTPPLPCSHDKNAQCANPTQ